MTESSPSSITIHTLARLKEQGEKIVCLTAYDATFARVAEEAGVEILLVGDSLGMVLQGYDSTLPVQLQDMIYHSACVARGSSHCLRIVDMPFMSYMTPEQALGTAARLMGQGQAQMVKLEGGADRLPVVRHLTRNGVPVCGHLGLLPQSVHELGGYRVQGRDETSARQIREDALALQEAGAELLVLECIPAALGAEISASVRIPVIGIGAGSDCDGQVLVLHDMLGITPGKRPKFVKDFLAGQHNVADAIAAFVKEVKAGSFPGREHSYS